MLCLNATSTVNLLETYLMRRFFSVEPINVSSLNLVMSCQLLIKLQSDIRLSSGHGFTFTVMFKYVHYTF